MSDFIVPVYARLLGSGLTSSRVDHLRFLTQLLLLTAFLLTPADAVESADVKQVPLWDGETSKAPDGLLINRYGGPVVHGESTKITITHVGGVVHTGRGAYRAKIDGPVSDFAFFQLALSGFGPKEEYVMTRDILHFERLCLWLKNDTGAPFTLKLEIKDYRNDPDILQFQRFPINRESTWQQVCASLQDRTDWTILGDPDLRQTRFLGFIFDPDAGFPLNKAVYFDDVVLIEPGRPMDPGKTRLRNLVRQIARRQFDGMWGSRSFDHGLIPLNSVFADIGALNSTSSIVQLLPTAVEQGWVTQAEADEYIGILIGTLNRLMDKAKFLPPRYVDWLTLQPTFSREESPIDAALMTLALFQYRSLPRTTARLRRRIDILLRRFNFAPFGSAQGWKLAYLYDSGKFSDGTYDGYSGEIWIISLAAHLMPRNRVDITRFYHSGSKRTIDSCSGRTGSVVHSDPRFRAPFLQWLFPLFIDLKSFPKDDFPVPELATNPLRNAVHYQQDVYRVLTRRKRSLFLQPDAADDGSGRHYEQFSCYNSFGNPALFMPWSASFSLLADQRFAAKGLRNSLEHGLHGPLGLSDSVVWKTGALNPIRITARHDFWNIGLATMAMTSFLFGNNQFFTNIPQVREALEKVFPAARLPENSIGEGYQDRYTGENSSNRMVSVLAFS